MAEFPHVWLGVGQLGAAFREIAARGIEEVCFIGGLGRPEFADLRPDWGAIKRLPEILRLLKGGDDHALKGVVKLFEAEGLRVVGVETLAPELLAAPGPMNRLPFPSDMEDDLAFGARMPRGAFGFRLRPGACVVASPHRRARSRRRHRRHAAAGGGIA